MLGARESGYGDKQHGVAFGDPFVTPPLKDTSHSSLDFGATYDFFKNFTAYASHESIYQPQSEARYTMGAPSLPPPITGVNDEAGVKWQSTDKLLNASLAFFEIEEKGLEETNPQDPSSNIPVLDNRKSSGFDLETTGQMLPGLQGSFSFTHTITNDTTIYGSAPLTSFAPVNKIKSFAVYRPPGSGIWSHFIVGGGVDWQSAAYTLAYICTDNPPNEFGCNNYYSVPLTAKAYATLKLKLGYKINSHMELSLTANNFTNVKAYSPLEFSNPNNYNFYIEPFNLLASLHAKW
jgi:outer membrane receptor for ferric coprogen and ferric-rhodotorulic acid